MTSIAINENENECEPVWVPLLQEDGDIPTGKVEILPSKQHVNGEEKSATFLTSHKPPAIELVWKNITYCVSSGLRKGLKMKSEKKAILKNISGAAYPGELVGILGPSGSGKSSLLNILSGYTYRSISGTVLMNGREKFKKNLSCYIMQQDIVLPQLTVKELITAAAHLKLSESVSNKEKANIVDEIIQMLALTECMNTRSKFLSGGERKRLCIAQELVNNPPVLFLDEPTSGLDSVTCMQCIKLLKQLAQQGHTIICSIHQPSANVLNTFDKLYILSEGECIYRGPVSDLLPFLAGYGFICPQFHNPADFIIEIASGVYGSEIDQLKLAAKSDDSSQPPSMNCIENGITFHDNLTKDEGKCQQYASGPWTQFKVILLRTYRSIFRHPLLTQLRMLMHVMLGVLIGLLYWKVGNDGAHILNNSAFIFFTMLFLLFTSIMPTVITFPLEMQTYLREQHNNWYRGYVYYLAKTAADLPFQIVFTCIFCLITYWMTDQPPELYRFALYCFICCMLSALSQSVGIISGAVSTVEVAVFIAPVSVVPVILFSNFFLKLDDMPIYLRWLSYLSYFKYCFQVMMHAVYGYDRPDLECSQLFCPFTSPAEFMEVMGVEKTVVMDDILVLFALFIIIRTIGYIIMVFKVRYRK